MVERTVEHDTIVVERRLAAGPNRVFAAWVEPNGRDRWDVPGDDWTYVTDARDVRVGGHDVIRFGQDGALDFKAETLYVDLVDARRLVATYTVRERDTLVSISLLTVEIAGDGTGTRMRVTEQVVFFDGRDSPVARLAGLEAMFDQIANMVDGTQS